MTKQKQGDKQPAREKTCFVIAPIGDPNTPERLRSDQVFKHMIRPVVEEFGYEPKRADLLASPGIITNQIMDYLFTSELVVADLTDHNPNVFYELALRHAFAKPVIPILKEGQKIPFDNNQVRTLFYNHNDLDSVEECKQGLREHIKVIEGGETRFSNPVTNTVELEKLKESANPEARQIGEILSVLAAMQEEIRSTSGSRQDKSNPLIGDALRFTYRHLGNSLSNIAQIHRLLRDEGVNEAAQNGEVSSLLLDTDSSLRKISRALMDVIESSTELDRLQQLKLIRNYQVMPEVPF